MKRFVTIALSSTVLLSSLSAGNSAAINPNSTKECREKKRTFVDEDCSGEDPSFFVGQFPIRNDGQKYQVSRFKFSQDREGASSSPDPTPKTGKSTATKYPPSEFNISVTGGRGLIRVGSPYTLDSGELAAAFNVVNFDRNPGDVDVFDFPIQMALGLPWRTEVFFSLSPTVRTNSVAQDPVGYPVPPLDLFVDTYPSSALRPEPYFLFAQEFPYKTYFVPNVTIDPPGHGAFASSSGNFVLGFKTNLLSEERNDRMGFGIRAYVENPTEEPVFNTFINDSEWRKYAGFSGELNFGLDFLASKKFRKTEFLFNLGYKKIGDTSRGLRVQYVDSSQVGSEGFLVGEPVETGLELRDLLLINAGSYLPVFKVVGHQVWLIGELGYTRYVGSGTPVERKVHPAEMRLALQFNFPGYPNLSIGVGWQILFNDAGDGDYRSTSFVTPQGLGDINFSELVDPALSASVSGFLSNQGATFSYNSSKVFSTNNPAFDAWRNISTDRQRIIGQGGGNWLAFITWRVASLW